MLIHHYRLYSNLICKMIQAITYLQSYKNSVDIPFFFIINYTYFILKRYS